MWFFGSDGLSDAATKNNRADTDSIQSLLRASVRQHTTAKLPTHAPTHAAGVFISRANNPTDF